MVGTIADWYDASLNLAIDANMVAWATGGPEQTEQATAGVDIKDGAGDAELSVTIRLPATGVWVDFEAFHRRATRTGDHPDGFVPYDYQRRLAEQGHPELLRVPTGAGKTAAAVLPWLWRRQNPATRGTTPRRLVFTLPMRTLVEQTHTEIARWLANLDLAVADAAAGADELPCSASADEAHARPNSRVGLYKLVGGAGRADGAWRHRPDRDTILAGTLDQTLSRALNRGYGVSRCCWPIDFGLLHSDTLWVFDEIQLMGPALKTSRQLDAFRSGWGTVAPCRSMWMSATVDPAALSTVDNAVPPSASAIVELEEADRVGPLARRLDAGRLVREVAADDDAAMRATKLARLLVVNHSPGTRTLAVVNSVARARELADAVHTLAPADVPVVLLHSRFRPVDRRAAYDAIVSAPGPAGQIIISTQVLEAGVDLSARVLLTEAAPWPSIVQRAGRCNRDGSFSDAELLWCEPPSPEPYNADDVAAAVRKLRQLDKRQMTTEEINRIVVDTTAPVYPVLRRRDLLNLFDTTPDLTGNDIDVGRYLRDGDDLDVSVGWLDVPDGQVPATDTRAPLADWLCPVPIREMRETIKQGRRVFRFDGVEGRWLRCIRSDQVGPGQVLVLPASEGRYNPTVGWDPTEHKPVPVGPPIAADGPDPLASPDEPVDDGTATCAAPRWVSLRQHASDVERWAGVLAAGLPDELRQAVVVAGRLHDIGKAHDEGFQTMLLKAAGDEAPPQGGDVWAKSPRPGRTRNTTRPWFRHELASALALLSDGAVALAGVAEPDLVVYLVAAHHGRVRLGVRSMPAEQHGRVLGIAPGDVLPAITLVSGMIPESKLDLSLLEVGHGDGGPSWTARALALRDRPGLGVFRLATLEALVRMADWAASRSPGEEIDDEAVRAAVDEATP